MIIKPKVGMWKGMFRGMFSRGGTPAVATCTTPTGTTLTESFGDSTTSCWTSGPTTCNNTWTIGAGAPSIAASPGTPAANTACTNSLLCSGVNGAEVNVIRAFPAPIDDAVSYNVIFYLYMANEAIANSSEARILYTRASNANIMMFITLKSAWNSILTLRGSGLTDSTDTQALSVNTWYKVTLSYGGQGAGACSLQVDSGTPVTFTAQAQADTNDVQVGLVDLSTGDSIDIYIGCLAVN
jgi:hypothetical protein